jgi:hypothetical protein
LNQLDISRYGENLLNPDIDIDDYFDWIAAVNSVLLFCRLWSFNSLSEIKLC